MDIRKKFKLLKLKFYIYLVGLIFAIGMILIVVVTIVAVIDAIIPDFPDFNNEKCETQEICVNKQLIIYENASEKVKVQTGVYIDPYMVMTVDYFYYKAEFSKTSETKIFENTLQAVAYPGSMINEDNNLNNSLDKKEDINQNGSLDKNYEVPEELITRYSLISYSEIRFGYKVSINEKNIEEYSDYYQKAYDYFKGFGGKAEMYGGAFIIPIEQPYVITQDYGNYNPDLYGSLPHNGIDYSYTGGKPGGDIYAVAPGVVTESISNCPNVGMGTPPNTSISTACANLVTIKHNIEGQDVYSHYGHLASVDVDLGDTVEQGDVIGIEGTSGYSSGRHLHFGVYDASKNTIDPNPFLNGEITGDGSLTEDKIQLMKEANISEDDFIYVDSIITKESGWNHKAVNPSSGALGLCQLNPNFHEIPEGYKEDKNIQMDWCNNYAIERYGTWKDAYEFWQANKWW